MATASTVQVQVGKWPQYYRPGISSESANKATELLQENHEKYHIFFNDKGFHNHIAHQLLTMWALHATPNQLQREYDHNKSYQRPGQLANATLVKDLQDPAKFMNHLGPASHYNDFLAFFQQEMEAMGWQEVLQKYVFDGDERAETMLVRMFSGVLHPLIHLGFGVEFNQPVIIAEALAQAACHDDWIGKLLLPAEEAAKEKRDAGSKSIVQLIDEINADASLRNSVNYADTSRFASTVAHIPDYLAQIRIKPEHLDEKVAEMTNAVAYFTSSAQRSDRALKIDFFFMHCANISIFFPPFLAQTWLSDANKVRLVEWMIRYNLVAYVAGKAPDLHPEEIAAYKPKNPMSWEEVQDRVCELEDDGHASKLIRALANGARISKPYEDKNAFRLKSEGWLQVANVVIASLEAPGPNWIRGPGFDEAWEDVPAKASL